jgi:hypothetical protein
MAAYVKSPEAIHFCLKKALDCQHAAMASTHTKTRQMYLHMSRLWRDMANAAEKEKAATRSRGVVISFPGRGKRLTAV